MKQLLSIILFLASFCYVVPEVEAQTSRVYQLEYLLGEGDTTFYVSALQFPESTNGLVVQSLFHNCASQDNASKVDLYQGAYLTFTPTQETEYSINPDVLGHALLVDSLNYVTADGASSYNFWKGGFYKSDLQIRIDASATATDSSGVVLSFWAITEEK